MKVLALDYGSARTGVAVSDPTGIIARPLCVVRGAGGEEGEEREPHLDTRYTYRVSRRQIAPYREVRAVSAGGFWPRGEPRASRAAGRIGVADNCRITTAGRHTG
jgi:hypothetical protein